jgi:hypothetical protein
MTTNGALPTFFLAVAVFSNPSVTMAESTATKPATQAAVARKAAPVVKPVSSADPFEETPTRTVPGARPVEAAQVKSARKTAAPAQPAPSKELGDFMKDFEGTWKCETSFPSGAMGAGSQPLNTRTDITIKKEFGGFSWHGEFKLAKTTITSATKGVFQISYSAANKQAVVLSYDSVGSAMMGAGVLAGDSVTFKEEGFLNGGKVKVRETLAAEGGRKFHHKVEIERGTGFQLVAEDTCSK